jgi:murein DD-endopeptidase MepM/ murein hydrolase activator NlpD
MTSVLAMTVAASLTVTPTARSMQPGELVILSVSAEVPMTEVHAEAFGTRIDGYAVDPTHWKLLVGIDLDATLGRHVVNVTAATTSGPLTATLPLTVVAKKFPTRRLQVDPAFVNPPPEALPRIAQDSKDQAAVWAASPATRLWTGPFIRPVPQVANSAFGTRSVFNGEPRNAHSGADFLSPAGTPVKAPNAGRVALAKDLYYSGNSVIVDHGLGVFSFFAHLSRIDVKVGDMVEPGDVLGLVGATGRVTGPHLHWTLRVAGARVDPLALLALLGNRK